MTNRIAETSPLIVARVAGIVYLVMGIFGAFSILYVPSSLIVPEDAATTANNIMASELLFRSGIVGSLLTQIIFIFLVLLLYQLLKPVNKNHALLMVIFALVAIPIAMLNELNQFATLLLLSGADYLTVFATDQLHTQVLLFLNLHEYGVLVAQIFWGLWLLPLGLLVFKSGFLPRILGILLMIGCFGYVIDSFALILFPNFKTIAQFTFVGELLLPLWLLIKGVNVEQWEQRNRETVAA